MDVSGSMMCSATSTATCMDICIALGVLFTYVNPGPFRDMAISFTDRPFTFDFTGMTVKQRIDKVFQHVGYTTNIQLMLQEYLRIATTNNIPENELADLVIFSDGGFDQMMGTNAQRWNTTVENMEAMFHSAGYTRMPQIYFANLNARQTNFQTQTSRKGVSQLNGYSPAMFQQILTGDRVLDTLSASASASASASERMKSTEDDFQGMVNDKFYDIFRIIFTECTNGLLSEYNFVPLDETVLETHQETLDMLALTAPAPALAPLAALTEPALTAVVAAATLATAPTNGSYWSKLW